MGENWFQREFMVPRRLAFNVLFYGLHFGIFAYGWYSQVCIYVDLAPCFFLTSSAGHESASGWTQHPEVFGLDITRSWTRSRVGWRSHSPADVAQHSPYYSTKVGMAVPRGREHLVPSSGRLLHGFLGDGAHDRALCEFHQRRAHS